MRPVLLLLALACAVPARGQTVAPWPLCTAAGDQTGPRHAGSGVFWMDARDAGNPDLYRSPDRSSDPQPFVAAPGWQSDVRASDETATACDPVFNPPEILVRAMVTWVDSRSGDLDIRARADGNGFTWTPVDAPVCVVPGFQTDPRIVEIVASASAPAWVVGWLDRRSGIDRHVYAQRLAYTAAGVWTTNGVPVCTTPGWCGDLDLTADGTGGALFAWTDPRGGVYVQRLTGAGVPAAGWPADGVAAGAPDEGARPRVVADGNGGALVCWTVPGLSGEPGDFDVFAQHLDAGGAVAPGWPVAGIALCTAARHQEVAAVVSDAQGGMIVTWVDGRNVVDEQLSPDYDIRALRVTGAGTIAAGWAADGTVACGLPFEQSNAAAIADGEGGVYIAWESHEGSLAPSDIRATHLDAAGRTPDAGGQYPWRWPADGADGVMLCAAPGAQTEPAVGMTCDGHLLVTWVDERDAATTGRDIYAVTMSPYGGVALGVPASAPARLALGAPVPNPGRGPVRAPVTLPGAAAIEAWVADVAGRRVATLVAGARWPAGVHELRWDGRDAAGRTVPAGVYALHVRAGDGSAMRSVVRLR